MADDHVTVGLSITATLAAACIILAYVEVIAGGAADLILRFVVPLVISSITLSIFFVLVFVRNRAARRKQVEAKSQAA